MTDPIDLYLDLETFCETPIKDGVHRYAEDAEILISAWAQDDPLFGEGEIIIEDLADDWEGHGQTIFDPSDVFLGALDDTLCGTGKIIMHNGGQFDRTVLRHKGFTIP